MAHLDFKITSWRRVFVPDDKINETIKLLKEGGCDQPYDLMDIKGYYDATTYDDQCCEEPMLPNENDGCSTQELYSEDGNIVYRNGNEE
jgi:hypothetical protein